MNYYRKLQLALKFAGWTIKKSDADDDGIKRYDLQHSDGSIATGIAADVVIAKAMSDFDSGVRY